MRRLPVRVRPEMFFFLHLFASPRVKKNWRNHPRRRGIIDFLFLLLFGQLKKCNSFESHVMDCPVIQCVDLLKVGRNVHWLEDCMQINERESVTDKIT